MSGQLKLLIIGVGLIGGSLALALRKADKASEIVGAGRTLASLEKAVQLGVIDRYTTDLTAEVSSSDVVVVATPVMTVDSVFNLLSRADCSSSVITDVGSVKGSIVDSARRHLISDFDQFVPGHPIAGREHSGVTAATADLFVGKRTILTPTSETNSQSVEIIREMWEDAGSDVSLLGVDEHDDLVSASSHLPHMVAFGLVHYIANHGRSRACFDLAASGFYDFTRIASSDPTMWRDICLANSAAVARELNGYIDELISISKTISNQDSKALEQLIKTAKKARDKNLAQWLG